VKTKIIAFGGYLYPIAKWLPSYVQHIAAGPFGFSRRWCRDFAATIAEPVILIGFSEGANAVLQVASHSPMARIAVVHSCEDKPVEFAAGCQYRFFVTRGDTTPTFDGTVSTATRAMKAGIQWDIQFLKPIPFESPTWFERRVLAPRNHIFHNVLPCLTTILRG